MKNQTLYFKTENSNSGAEWDAEFENRIYFMIQTSMTSLWRHKRQKINFVILRQKVAVLVQNELLNPKIIYFMIWTSMTSLWRHKHQKRNLFILGWKIAVLVQNEPLNSKIILISWFEQEWHTMTSQTSEHQTLPNLVIQICWWRHIFPRKVSIELSSIRDSKREKRRNKNWDGFYRSLPHWNGQPHF